MRSFRYIAVLVALFSSAMLPNYNALALSDGNMLQVEEPVDRALSREKYLRERLDAIAKAADLTTDEKEVVSELLEKYDQARFKAWAETKEVHKEMKSLGDNASPEQYLAAYKNIQKLAQERHQASNQFMEELLAELTPKKAYQAYGAYHFFNGRMSVKLRGK